MIVKQINMKRGVVQYTTLLVLLTAHLDIV
jgi:hypothetical protein